MHLIFNDVRFIHITTRYRIFVNSIKKSRERDVRGRAYGFIERDRAPSISFMEQCARLISFIRLVDQPKLQAEYSRGARYVLVKRIIRKRAGRERNSRRNELENENQARQKLYCSARIGFTHERDC